MSYRNAKPIDWEPYKGETVNTNLTIRKGKKYQETAWYDDRVKAVPRGNAYIIGNGPSRKDFELNRLKPTGETYGCNALYRDFLPDYIFSVDSPITLEMVKEKVYEKCIHYTPSLEVNRYPKGGPSHLHLIPNNPHWISGSAAMWTATVHGHTDIYLIGFDFREYGKNMLNNIYQDSPIYGPRDSETIFEGWLGQFRSLQVMRPNCKFTVVHDDPPDYLQVSNPGAEEGRFRILSYKEFEETILASPS